MTMETKTGVRQRNKACITIDIDSVKECTHFLYDTSFRLLLNSESFEIEIGRTINSRKDEESRS